MLKLKSFEGRCRSCCIGSPCIKETIGLKKGDDLRSSGGDGPPQNPMRSVELAAFPHLAAYSMKVHSTDFWLEAWEFPWWFWEDVLFVEKCVLTLRFIDSSNSDASHLPSACHKSPIVVVEDWLQFKNNYPPTSFRRRSILELDWAPIEILLRCSR